MRVRRGVLLTLVILAFALGATACGNTSKATTTSAAQTKAAQVHWRAGLKQWRDSMLHALDGISLLFSTANSFADLQVPHTKAANTLHRYEATLTNCDTALGHLGPVPPGFDVSGQYAKQACDHLAKGELLVEAAVVKLSHPPSAVRLASDDPLQAAGVPLGAGQTELATAVHALPGSA